MGTTAMPKPEIEKFHVLHKLENEFDVSDDVRQSLHAQLNEEDQDRISRFMEGFEIEDWFRWTFSAMPWAHLIHGLHQQQSPVRSKSEFQVPDYLTVFEASDLTLQPLLVEVKRVSGMKMTLEIQESQIGLCEKYASTLNIPLVYAVYWQRHSAWTLNTPDSFVPKSSTRKLELTTAFELDCGTVLGDISFLIPQSIARVTVFDHQAPPDGIRHETLGTLVSDDIRVGDREFALTTVETAAVDSILSMRDVSKTVDGSKTTISQRLDENYLTKLSNWITRHLAIFGITPTEEHSNVSAHTITNLMEKLECTRCHMFPTGRTPQISQLDQVFRTSLADSEAT